MLGDTLGLKYVVVFWLLRVSQETEIAKWVRSNE